MKIKKSIITKRKQKILQILKDERTITVQDLVNRLSVSAITIRRDLEEFEKNALVERFYGGAKLIDGALRDDPSQSNQTDQTLLYKEAIAEQAAQFVNDGDTIFLNSSSTALLMLKYIIDKRVVVITNNGNALNISRDSKIELVLTGGEVYERKNSLLGDITLQILSKLRANKCFVGVSGVNENGELSTSVLQETGINTLMIKHSNEKVIILADSTKIGKQNNFIIATTNDITNLITDEDANDEVLAAINHPNLEITKVSVGNSRKESSDFVE